MNHARLAPSLPPFDDPFEPPARTMPLPQPSPSPSEHHSQLLRFVGVRPSIRRLDLASSSTPLLTPDHAAFSTSTLASLSPVDRFGLMSASDLRSETSELANTLAAITAFRILLCARDKLSLSGFLEVALTSLTKTMTCVPEEPFNAMVIHVACHCADQPSSTGFNHAKGTTCWELALVTALSSNESALAMSRSCGRTRQAYADSLYDDAMRRNNQSSCYNPWEPAPMASPMMQPTTQDPFFASSVVFVPLQVQMEAMHQQKAFILQQQQMMLMGSQMQQLAKPFQNPYVANVHPYGSSVSVQAYNPYLGLI